MCVCVCVYKYILSLLLLCNNSPNYTAFGLTQTHQVRL